MTRSTRSVRQPFALALWRSQVDLVDAGMRRLLALRRGLVCRITALKQRRGMPERDADRELAMASRACHDGARLGLPNGSAAALMTLALDASRPSTVDAPPAADATPDIVSTTRLAGALRRPRAGFHALLQRALAGALARPIAAGAFDLLAGRRVAVEVPELRFRLCVVFGERTLTVLPHHAEAEATVRGSLPDLLALVGRAEDADALFFQRRLELTGDVELGLTLRNLLDRLPWEEIPLGLRIALSRGARLAQRLRR